MNKILWSRKTDNWKSPDAILKAYEGYFDPCPIDAKRDGLKIAWRKRNYVNPPYSQVRPWIEKAIAEQRRGNFTAMLLPARTDTRWFHDLLWRKDRIAIEFIRGRLKFGGNNYDAPFPNMFVYFIPQGNEKS